MGRVKCANNINGYCVKDYGRKCRPQGCPYKTDKVTYTYETMKAEVTIEGVTFVTADGKDEKNCLNCDIYKMRPPRSMASYPLCYEYKYHKHYIHEYCAGHQVIWKKEDKK